MKSHFFCPSPNICFLLGCVGMRDEWTFNEVQAFGINRPKDSQLGGIINNHRRTKEFVLLPFFGLGAQNCGCFLFGVLG